ncbi:hypothetical protein AcV5_000660 [Taiwanofungus camphoratus]|nr:hypothetical protein AcV5_000660 [Antrodia cinnamomea]
MGCMICVCSMYDDLSIKAWFHDWPQVCHNSFGVRDSRPRPGRGEIGAGDLVAETKNWRIVRVALTTDNISCHLPFLADLNFPLISAQKPLSFFFYRQQIYLRGTGHKYSSLHSISAGGWAASHHLIISSLALVPCWPLREYP